jgi:orotidine-5'-phosphate decarboxylase/adenine/guanine phosphoribosyltransferase-like PRPP-binding protein
MKKKPFVLGLDGFKNSQAVWDTIKVTLQEPSDMADFVSHFKFNDALHLEGMKGEDGILPYLIHEYPEIFIFWDLKLQDTNGTDKNILLKYLKYMRPGDILTMVSTSSLRAFREVRALIPAGVKIAIVSVLTDTEPDECRMRRGMLPGMAILNDATNLLETKECLFNSVVCSPAELPLLKKNLPDCIEFITPAIRDSWMDAGQQSADRIDGIKNTMDGGADLLVLGGQLMKGNPEKNISAAESRKLSIAEALRSDALCLIKGNPLETLINLEGHYQSRKTPDGKFLGPLVAYSGKYPSPTGKKNFVGDVYFNLAVIEDHPQRLNYFAKLMVEKIRAFEASWGHKVDCLIGAPEGGSKIAQEVGRLMGIPGLRLEKEVTALKTATAKEEFDLVMRRNAGALKIGWFALIFEDLCNNFGTTQKAISALDDRGVVTVGIACVANRSKDHVEEWEGLPVIAGIAVPSDQYEQEDPLVADLIAAGKLSTDPKRDWADLKAAMEE